MQNRPDTVDTPIAAKMQEVNKLIFIQRFGQALDLLRGLSREYEEDYEVQFRLVEVATRTGDLFSVTDELRSRSQQTPAALALQFAWTLAQIRTLEVKQEPEPSVTDASASLQRTDRPTFGGAENVGLHQFEAVERLLPTRGLGTRGTFQIDRKPQFPDDGVVPSIDNSARWADLERADVEDTHVPEPVQRARDFALKYPDNYAAWFLAGCALEHIGSLQEAVEAWKRASVLKPNAVSVLAIMAELQQIGVLPDNGIDYSQSFEQIDRFLVHGSLETHLILYRDYMLKGEYANAITALRTLADWLQRQNGYVPPEIEILSLLGAMRAYEIAGNSEAAGACRSEVFEILTNTRQTSQSPVQMKFIADILQQFGFELQAAECFLTLLQMPDTPLDVAVQTASHLVAFSCDDRLKEALEEAYRIHNGATELRLIQVAHSLTTAGVSIRPYMERRNLIRHKMSFGSENEVLALLELAFSETQEDSETHYYMAELQMRLGNVELARHHFEEMYRLDFLNSDSTMRFIYFLLKAHDYSRAQELASKALTKPNLRDEQVAELDWALATALFALEDRENATRFIERAMNVLPWNGAYLALALRISKPQCEAAWWPQNDVVLQEVEDALVGGSLDQSSFQVHKWIEHASRVLQAGFTEYAYLFARAFFVAAGRGHQDVVDLLARAGATLNSRIAVQHILRLLNSPSVNVNVGLAQAAALASQVYTNSGEWDLADEWNDISGKSGLDDKILRSRLMEQSALRLAIQGKDLARAKSLIEAALDVLNSERADSGDAEILYSYILVCLGEIKRGADKLKMVAGDNMSILSLYFIVKGLERAGENENLRRNRVAQLFQARPTTGLERRLLEEIYVTLGASQQGMSIALAC